MGKTKTNDLTKHVIYLLIMSGYHAWRANNGAVFDPVKKVFRRNVSLTKGIPDVLAFHKQTGKFLCVEIKTGRDKLSPEQTDFLETARKAACIALEVREINDLIKVI